MSLPTLTNLPDAPNPADGEAQFDALAYPFTAALIAMVPELRSFGDALQQLEETMAANAVAANLADVDFSTIAGRLLGVNASGDGVLGVPISDDLDLENVSPAGLISRLGLSSYLASRSGFILGPTLFNNSTATILGIPDDAVEIDIVLTSWQASVNNAEILFEFGDAAGDTSGTAENAFCTNLAHSGRSSLAAVFVPLLLGDSSFDVSGTISMKKDMRLNEDDWTVSGSVGGSLPGGVANTTEGYVAVVAGRVSRSSPLQSIKFDLQSGTFANGHVGVRWRR